LHPAHHDYYYYVAKNSLSPNEGHQFSATLMEHAIAVTNARESEFYFNDDLIRSYFWEVINEK